MRSFLTMLGIIIGVASVIILVSLVNAYMSLSPTMRIFGTSINDEFGDVWETGLIVNIADIFEEKKDRHVRSYERELSAKERL